MSYDSDRIAFYTEMLTEWGSRTPIIFDTVSDDDKVTQGSDPWVNCFLEPIETSQKNIGTSTSVLYRTPGLFIVDIYDREDNGSAEILRLADVVRDIFLGQFLNGSAIYVKKVSLLRREPYLGWNSRRSLVYYESTEYTSRA
jgi:hypothetical protein